MTVFGIKNDSASAKTTRYIAFLLKVLPLVAFAVPLAMLYLLNPMDTYLNVSAQQSFELMWKGRTFQLFFLCFFVLFPSIPLFFHFSSFCRFFCRWERSF